MSETPAQIAARLGVGLAPGVAVTRVATGVSAYVLDPATGSLILGKYLAAPPAEKQRLRRAAFSAMSRVARPPDAEVARRRDEVRGWHARGLCNADIAAMVQVAMHIVTADLSLMRLPANRAAARIAEVGETPGEMRLRKIRDMLSRGHGCCDIAGALGLSVRALAMLATKAGIVLPGQVKPPPRLAAPGVKVKARVKPPLRVAAPGAKVAPPPRLAYDQRPGVIARRERVAAARQAGMSTKDIVKALAIGTATLARDMRFLGLPPESAAGMARAGARRTRLAAEARALRLAPVVALMDQGLALADAAARLGLVERRVRAWMDKSGLAVPPLARAGALRRATRDRDIEARHGQGATLAEIHRATGLAKGTIIKALARSGLVAHDASHARTVAAASANRAIAAARHAAIVAAGRRLGGDVAAVVAETGASRWSVPKVLRAAGIRPRMPLSDRNADRLARRAAEVSARRDLVAAMYAAGAPRADIVAATGASAGTVCADITALRAAGLRPPLPPCQLLLGCGAATVQRALRVHRTGADGEIGVAA